MCSLYDEAFIVLKTNSKDDKCMPKVSLCSSVRLSIYDDNAHNDAAVYDDYYIITLPDRLKNVHSWYQENYS
jgi:hypothetical protein